MEKYQKMLEKYWKNARKILEKWQKNTGKKPASVDFS